MTEETLAVIVPTYGAFEYAARAIRTALDNTHTPASVIVVDDASPDWNRGDGIGNGHLSGLQHVYGASRVRILGFTSNGGLTRSWNAGLRAAREGGFTYACCANSDLLFSSGWDLPLVYALRAGADLVGPVTNTPGTERCQDVSLYSPHYELTDDQRSVDETGLSLFETFGPEFREAKINGFCMLARTETWWSGAFDPKNVFRPRNDYDSRGRRNPTPLMTLNEYELQGRWLAAGRKTGFCPGSFVFHYRSVSRGDAHKKGKWYRMGT